MGWKSSLVTASGVALLVALATLGRAAPLEAAALPQTGGFISFSTLLLIAGGVLLVIVGAIAYAILSRRGTRQ